MKIGIVVFNDFTDLDFYLPWDLLNRVRLLKLHADWQVEILSGRETRKLIKDKDFLSRFCLDESKQFIAAIDSGALILGALGLLEGKQATTYPTAFEALGDYCEVVEKPFVESGRIATGARCLSGDRLALWIIEKLTNSEIVQKVYEAVMPLALHYSSNRSSIH